METQPESKTSKKIFLILAVFLVIVGLFFGYVTGVVISFKLTPYIVRLKYEIWLKEYLKPYKEDYIGGDTPEQTIDLFIEALKKGDYNLASKYFEIEQQEKWKKDFNEAERKNIEEWILELEKGKENWHKDFLSDKKVEFWYNVKNGEPSRDINLIKNLNNKWKIGSL